MAAKKVKVYACPKCGGSDKLTCEASVNYVINKSGKLTYVKDPKLTDVYRITCKKCNFWDSSHVFQHEQEPKTGDRCKTCQGTGKIERESFNGYSYKDSCGTCSGKGQLNII
jgi:hypothetical protein